MRRQESCVLWKAPSRWLLIASISSIALAVAAIGISESAERESRENSQKTKEALAEIDKKPAVIEGA